MDKAVTIWTLTKQMRETETETDSQTESIHIMLPKIQDCGKLEELQSEKPVNLQSEFHGTNPDASGLWLGECQKPMVGGTFNCR